MFRRATSFSTAPTPPLCESPTDGSDSSYEEFVIRLSVNKLENKKHTSRLRNATLIRSVHQRALQQALTSTLSWEAPARLQDFTVGVRVRSPSPLLSPSIIEDNARQEGESAEDGFSGPSVWDMVDAWEASRKRGEDALMDDSDDVPKRLCLGLDSMDTHSEFLPSLSWDSPVLMSA